VIGVAILKLGQAAHLFSKRYELVSFVPNTAGLRVGGQVTVAGQLASAARLLLPKHLPLIAAISSEQAELMRYREARSWLDPYESLAAQEYCLQLDRNVHALRCHQAQTAHDFATYGNAAREVATGQAMMLRGGKQGRNDHRPRMDWPALEGVVVVFAMRGRSVHQSGSGDTVAARMAD